MAIHRWLLSLVFLVVWLTVTPATAGVKFFFSFGGGHRFQGHLWHGPLFHRHHPHFGGHGFFGAPHLTTLGPMSAAFIPRNSSMLRLGPTIISARTPGEDSRVGDVPEHGPCAPHGREAVSPHAADQARAAPWPVAEQPI
jgi:hypothetical protein